MQAIPHADSTGADLQGVSVLVELVKEMRCEMELGFSG
jgi:hypothetical protein